MRVPAYQRRRDGDFHMIRPADHATDIGLATICPCGCGRERVVHFRGYSADAVDPVGMVRDEGQITLREPVEMACGRWYRMTKDIWTAA